MHSQCVLLYCHQYHEPLKTLSSPSCPTANWSVWLASRDKARGREGRTWSLRVSRGLASSCASTTRPPAAQIQPARGGLVFKAHRRLYHSTLGSRVIMKKKNIEPARFGRPKLPNSQHTHRACHLRNSLLARETCAETKL